MSAMQRLGVGMFAVFVVVAYVTAVIILSAAIVDQGKNDALDINSFAVLYGTLQLVTMIGGGLVMCISQAALACVTGSSH